MGTLAAVCGIVKCEVHDLIEVLGRHRWVFAAPLPGTLTGAGQQH